MSAVISALNHNAWMVFVLAIMVVVVFCTLSITSRNRNNSFRAADLLIGDDGKASKAAVIMFGAFAITSWIMVYLTTAGRLEQGYFIGYCAIWATPAVTVLITHAAVAIKGTPAADPPK